ncbi:MAG TPA: hypothetical protein VMT46_08085 [Anaerolineaceae bacterium]|nr:hypothetical protein [Anaerolineaceae bacterium]
MKSVSFIDGLFVTVLVLISSFYFWGIDRIPFHPDETTQIFMSSDLQTLFQDPGRLAWTPGMESDLRTHYRLLDAPLTRDLIGLARSLAGAPALPVDWDWTQNWDQNLARGAYPQDLVLWISRLVITGLVPLGLILLYRAGAELGSPWIGLASVVFFGLNSLVLLHARRAMAEGAMLVGILFYLYLLLHSPQRSWFLALAAALAFNAKYSTLVLFPVGALALILVRPQKRPWSWLGKHLSIYAGVFLLVTVLLNPFLWKDPLRAAQTAIQERLRFVQGQADLIGASAPELVLHSPANRAAAFLAETFLTQPAYYDVANYATETTSQVKIYQQTPGHLLSANLVWSGFILVLAVFGFLAAGLRYRNLTGEQRRKFVLLAVAGLCQWVALMVSVPIPFQRYYLPFLPYICIWSACGSFFLAQPFVWRKKPDQQATPG